MNHPIFLIEYSLTGPSLADDAEGTKATILNEVEITARDAASAHTIFVERCKALELTAQVLEITENDNYLDEAKELAIELSEKLENIQYQFDQYLKGKQFLSDDDYRDLKTWYEENVECTDLDL